jgi:aryl-alcohol dehydrogenase-like predicted oxidoreductase
MNSHVRLPGIDQRIFRIGLGCMSLARSQSYGGVSQEKANRIVYAAIDAGITLFDNAPMYGDGDAEEKLGRALEGRRKHIVIATKASGPTLSREELTRDCEASLRRLRTDFIDLYQLHWNRRAVPMEESVQALAQLRGQGKIRSIGVCNFGPVDMKAFLALGSCVTDQIAYSLLTRAVEFELADLCARRGVGLICYSPLAQGLLTDRFGNADEVPAGRARTRHFAGNRPEATHGENGCEAEAFSAINAISKVAERLCTSLSHLALAWLLHRRDVTAVLPGASTPAQVKSNAEAMMIKLSTADVAELDAATEGVRLQMGANLDPWQDSGRIR